MKVISITIGIAAYNAEKNIKYLLTKLLKQKTKNIKIKKIIVYSDCSIDNTVKLARSVKNKKIRILDIKQRFGFANSVRKLFYESKGSYLVILNDDIKIYDNNFIQELCSAFANDHAVGMVTGNPVPFKGITFVQKAIVTSFKVYEKMKYKIREGNNVFTCDGKVMAFSPEFMSSISTNTNWQRRRIFIFYLFTEWIPLQTCKKRNRLLESS